MTGSPAIEAAKIEAALYRLRDEAAALHLFRVAAGLDSLVPGEGEILGQVRAAFEGRSPGPFLDKLFQQALHAGRRVQLRDGDQRAASVPSAAAALAQRVFDDLAGRRVLVLGAGKTDEPRPQPRLPRRRCRRGGRTGHLRTARTWHAGWVPRRWPSTRSGN